MGAHSPPLTWKERSHFHNFTHWSWLADAMTSAWGESANAAINPMCAGTDIVLLLSVGFHSSRVCSKNQMVSSICKTNNIKYHEIKLCTVGKREQQISSHKHTFVGWTWDVMTLLKLNVITLPALENKEGKISLIMWLLGQCDRTLKKPCWPNILQLKNDAL